MPGYGILAHPWWVPVLWIVVLGHVTNIGNTLYLHRSATHGGVRFHPLAEYFMRTWIWLTTGIVTREWVAVHRKHHAFADREGDPHSPEVEGLAAIALAGVFFYQKAARDTAMLETYGKDCPDDWMERNVFTGKRSLGLLLMLALDLYLFGLGIGLLVWSIMAIWMPIMGNIINGIGHAWGYRNFATRDKSRNIYPWGIWILGEELHNNHHADPKSAKFRARWFEFDIGWIYIRLLSLVGLARVVYARKMSAAAFRAKHYGSQAKAKVKAAGDGARERVGDAKRKLGEAATNAGDGARERVGDAKRKLGEAATNARAGLEKPAAD